MRSALALYALPVTYWLYALRVVRYVLRFTCCVLRVTLRFTCCVALYVLRFTRCVLRVMLCALRVVCCVLRIAFYVFRVTFYALRVAHSRYGFLSDYAQKNTVIGAQIVMQHEQQISR